MKEVETIVTKYMANDGTRFDDKESCEKHEAECLKLEKECADRIAMIKAKRKSIDEANAEFERKQNLSLEELTCRIYSLKSRINMVIRVAEEMKANKFNWCDFKYQINCGIDFYGETNFKIGFYVDMYPLVGAWLFCTDGESIEYNINGLGTDKKINACEKFLNRFDKFETEFYKWVDGICKSENAK